MWRNSSTWHDFGIMYSPSYCSKACSFFSKKGDVRLVQLVLFCNNMLTRLFQKYSKSYSRLCTYLNVMRWVWLWDKKYIWWNQWKIKTILYETFGQTILKCMWTSLLLELPYGNIIMYYIIYYALLFEIGVSKF